MTSNQSLTTEEVISMMRSKHKENGEFYYYLGQDPKLKLLHRVSDYPRILFWGQGGVFPSVIGEGVIQYLQEAYQDDIIVKRFCFANPSFVKSKYKSFVYELLEEYCKRELQIKSAIPPKFKPIFIFFESLRDISSIINNFTDDDFNFLKTSISDGYTLGCFRNPSRFYENEGFNKVKIYFIGSLDSDDLIDYSVYRNSLITSHSEVYDRYGGGKGIVYYIDGDGCPSDNKPNSVSVIQSQIRPINPKLNPRIVLGSLFNQIDYLSK